MSLRSLIRENLITFIKSLEQNEDSYGLSNSFIEYEERGKEVLITDLNRAIDSLLELSKYQFIDIFENIRDLNAVKRGVLISKKLIKNGGPFNLGFLESSAGTDMELDDYVYEWAEQTLQNPYYTDLFSKVIKCPDGIIDQEGFLSGLKFYTSSYTNLLITDSYEFIPIQTNEIYIVFSDGEEFTLYKNTILDNNIKPYDTLEELLYEIIDMESVLQVADE